MGGVGEKYDRVLQPLRVVDADDLHGVAGFQRAGARLFAVLIQLAWLLGVYQRRIRPEGIVRQALFTTCFPYVLSGPLVRYEEMGPQLDALEVPQAEDLARGLGLMVLGLAKKVLLADSLAPAADAVFHAAAQGLPLSTAEAWG